MPVLTTNPTIQPVATLSVTRLNVLRLGYAFMAVGLTLKKWPLMVDLADRPVYESVTITMLVAMSLLAWLGLRYPARLLPVLLFESAWKLLWLSAVALPLAVSGDLDSQTSEIAANCLLVFVVLAVTPWRYVWRSYVRAPADPWR